MSTTKYDGRKELASKDRADYIVHAGATLTTMPAEQPVIEEVPALVGDRAVFGQSLKEVLDGINLKLGEQN